MQYNNRLDHADTYHHIICRAVDGCYPFASKEEKQYLVDSLRIGFRKSSSSALAWVILGNHFHILLHCSGYPVSKLMQMIQIRFAQHYNVTHSRKGHLFMGRFKSIRVQEGEYLLELIRYIHLNPLRAGCCESLAQLPYYEFSGHRSVSTGEPEEWHDLKGMLSLFGTDTGEAHTNYMSFLQLGCADSDRNDLESGIWLSGRSGITSVASGLEGSRRYGYTGAIIGTRDYAASIAAGAREHDRIASRSRELEHARAEWVIEEACSRMGFSLRELRSHGKCRNLVATRKVIAYVLEKTTTFSRSDIARILGVAPSTATRLIAAGGWRSACGGLAEDMIRQVLDPEFHSGSKRIAKKSKPK